MNSGWKREIVAVLRKEVMAELRGRSGLLTSLLFSLVSIVAIAYATVNVEVTGRLASGLLWVTLLFSAVVALPRTFIVEEEQGTADLLRLWARPHAIYWGKLIFNFVQMFGTALLLSILFFFLMGIEVRQVALYLLALAFGCGALAGAVTLCGAIVAQASNRGTLAGAIALPLLVPLVAILIAATKFSLGDGLAEISWQATAGLGCYTVAALTLGPWIFQAIWKP
ncbi:MAG: heme exporter protein CcmB [Fimbriimonadaceae bacterium]|nr:heme exporter protein CcmB [Fimbriimonadaceae bacterium]